MNEARQLLRDENSNMMAEDIVDDAVTLVDASESRRGSTALSTMSESEPKRRGTNRASLTLLRFVFAESISQRTTSTLDFLTTEDAEFVTKAANAARTAAQGDEKFWIGISQKPIEYIPEYWLELVASQIEVFVISIML